MTSSSRLRAYQAHQGNAEAGLARSLERGKLAAREQSTVSFHAARGAVLDIEHGDEGTKAAAAEALQRYCAQHGAPMKGGIATSASAGAGPADRTFSQADLNSAWNAAVSAERARISAVFASEHSTGRERDCATLLASSKGFTAAAIIDLMAHESAQGTAGEGAGASQESSDAWDQVNANRVQDDRFLSAAIAGGRARLPNTDEPARANASGVGPAPTNDDVWARAYGEGRATHAQEATSTKGSTVDIWANAYRSAAR